MEIEKIDEFLLRVFEDGIARKQYFEQPTNFHYARTCYHKAKIEKLTILDKNSSLRIWSKRSLLVSLTLGMVLFLPAAFQLSKVYAMDQLLTKATGGKYNLSNFKEKICDYMFAKNNQNVRIWKLTEEGQVALSFLSYGFALLILIPILFPEGKVKIPHSYFFPPSYFPSSLRLVENLVEVTPEKLIENIELLVCEPKVFTNLYDFFASEEVQVILKSSMKKLTEEKIIDIIEKL